MSLKNLVLGSFKSFTWSGVLFEQMNLLLKINSLQIYSTVQGSLP